MAAPGPVAHRFSVDDYYRMAEVGILAPHRRYELIRGQVIAMAPEGPPHASAVDALSEAFTLAASGAGSVRIPPRSSTGVAPVSPCD